MEKQLGWGRWKSGCQGANQSSGHRRKREATSSGLSLVVCGHQVCCSALAASRRVAAPLWARGLEAGGAPMVSASRGCESCTMAVMCSAGALVPWLLPWRRVVHPGTSGVVADPDFRACALSSSPGLLSPSGVHLGQQVQARPPAGHHPFSSQDCTSPLDLASGRAGQVAGPGAAPWWVHSRGGGLGSG